MNTCRILVFPLLMGLLLLVSPAFAEPPTPPGGMPEKLLAIGTLVELDLTQKPGRIGLQYGSANDEVAFSPLSELCLLLDQQGQRVEADTYFRNYKGQRVVVEIDEITGEALSCQVSFNQ